MIYKCGKRYNTFDGYLKEKFGTKISKIPLNGGFSCPNRDGTKSKGGCIYCSPMASGDFAGDASKSIREQFSDIRTVMEKKWKNAKFLPYFQAGTNTYAPLCRLKELYEQALSLPDCVGLCIATRPDCIPDEILLYLEEISKRTFLILELGLQSIFDTTGELINRHTTYAEFLDTYERLKNRGINVCVHLINGLPGEDREMMLESVKRVALLRPHSIKLHMLHILENTVCADMYREGKIKVFEKDEYVSLICDELEYIYPDTVIQRITGDGARDSLIAPLWSIKKFDVLNGVDKLLAERDSWQGKKLGFD